MKVPFPEVVDASMMNEYRACKHKFFRKDLQHWKPQGESIHLHAGAAFAKGLEAARIAFYTDGLDHDGAIARGVGALLTAYGDFEPRESDVKTADRMSGALVFYFDEWPMNREDGAHPTIMPSGKRAIEFSFAQPLPFIHPTTGNPIIYCGRSDMVCDWAGGTYIEDDKTATQLGESWVRQWELRGQFTGYSWAARESGIKTNGVLVRGISILKTKYGAAQAVTYRSDHEIDEWLATTLDDLREMQEYWERGLWKKNFGDSCSSYGGCSFVQICKSDNPETWLPMYFERRAWDPMERTETLLTLEDIPHA